MKNCLFVQTTVMDAKHKAEGLHNECALKVIRIVFSIE